MVKVVGNLILERLTFLDCDHQDGIMGKQRVAIIVIENIKIGYFGSNESQSVNGKSFPSLRLWPYYLLY